MAEVFTSGPSLQHKIQYNGLEKQKTIPQNLFATAEVSLQPILL